MKPSSVTRRLPSGDVLEIGRDGSVSIRSCNTAGPEKFYGVGGSREQRKMAGEAFVAVATAMVYTGFGGINGSASCLHCVGGKRRYVLKDGKLCKPGRARECACGFLRGEKP
jgi:hypothetical protein